MRFVFAEASIAAEGTMLKEKMKHFVVGARRLQWGGSEISWLVNVFRCAHVDEPLRHFKVALKASRIHGSPASAIGHSNIRSRVPLIQPLADSKLACAQRQCLVNTKAKKVNKVFIIIKTLLKICSDEE